MPNPLLELLGYVGETLDKPGAALRGLLAGRPGQLANLIPFSDTLGITDPAERVSGRQLLETHGMVSPDSGFMGDLAGFGAGLALDPLMWTGAALAPKAAGMLRGTRAAETAAAAAPIVSKVDDVSPLLTAMKPVEQVAQTAPEVASPLMQTITQAPPELAPTFFSRLEQAAQTLPETVSAQSVPNLLKKAPAGVAEEEILATKLREALVGKPKVTKEDVLKHLDENKIRVEEVVRRELPVESGPMNYGSYERGTQYQNYQTPGGKNYKELLLKLPDQNTDDIFRADMKKIEDAMAAGLPPDEAHTMARELSAKRVSYKSPHWDDENVLAHVRFNDRVGPKGEKILHIEEVQSDWHQAGKKQGYRSEPLPPVKWEPGADRSKIVAQAQIDDVHVSIYPNPDGTVRLNSNWSELGPENFRSVDEAKQFAASRITRNDTRIPDAPFKDTWHELAMKRMIRYAAENKYDKLTWNTGEAIQGIVGGELAGQKAFYDTKLPNWVNKYAKKWGVKVEYGPIGEVKPTSNFLAQTSDGMVAGEGATAAEAANEAARGLRRAGLPEDTPFKVLAQEPSPIVAHGIPITDALRNEVLFKGQPLLGVAPWLIGGSASPLLRSLMQPREDA